jgi:hypothetical protein
LFPQNELDRQQEVVTDKKIILFATAAGIVLATGAPALAQGDPDEGIARGVMHGIEGGDRHGGSSAS